MLLFQSQQLQKVGSNLCSRWANIKKVIYQLLKNFPNSILNASKCNDETKQEKIIQMGSGGETYIDKRRIKGDAERSSKTKW